MAHKTSFIVIAYDISSDKRRRKVERLLRAYGTRANFSVFECEMTESQFQKIKRDLQRLINPPTDSLLYYPLCKKCLAARYRQGGCARNGDHATVI